MWEIFEQETRFFDNLLNTKSLRLDPTVIELLPPRSRELSLEHERSTDEMKEEIKRTPNWKAVGADALQDELQNSITPNSSSPFTAFLSKLDDGRSPPAMQKCDHQERSRKDRSLSLQQLQWDFDYCPCRKKALLKIVVFCLSNYCEACGILREKQRRLSPVRSTTDMLFVVRRLQELRRETKSQGYAGDVPKFILGVFAR